MLCSYRDGSCWRLVVFSQSFLSCHLASLYSCVGLCALAIEITCIALQISSQAMSECQASVSDVEWVWFELV